MSLLISTFKGFMAWILTKFSDDQISGSVMEYLENKYGDLKERKNTLIAFVSCFCHFLFITLSLLAQKFKWGLIMFRKNMKISFRHLSRDRGYSLINVFGLTTGITCCIFIFLYVQYEMSYDHFHEDADRIYRIVSSVKRPTGITNYAGTSYQVTPYIKENLQKSAFVSRITLDNDCQVGFQNKMFKERGRDIPYVDQDIFRILSFEFINGNPDSALKRTSTVVITKQTKDKYFGEINPLGKVLKIGDKEYEVTGVIKNPPRNSTFRFNMLRSWSSLDTRRLYPRWLGNFHWTLIKLAPEENPQGFARLITLTIWNHSQALNLRSKVEYRTILQPIKQVYLHSENQIFERALMGNMLTIYLLSGLGIVVLIIVSINFMNLSTARSSRRACEIGMRKVVGAGRGHIFKQFMGESLLITTLSFVLAMIAVVLLLNTFNQLAQIDVEVSHLFNPGFLFTLLVAAVVLGLVAGWYPALLLSSFRPLSMLGGSARAGLKGKSFRKILIVVQYTFSIAMIIGVLLFSKQLNYMKNKPLGFDKEQKLIINMQDIRSEKHNPQSVKREFTQYSSILEATFSTNIPGRVPHHARLWPTGQKKTNSHNVNWINADGDFISVYGLEIIAGKNIRDLERTNLARYPAIMNETAVKVFGWESPEKILNETFRDEDPKGYVAGVVKDFHFQGLQMAIAPHVIILRGGYRYLTLKIKTDNLRQTLATVEQKFKDLFPGYVFDYFFLDEDFNQQYRKEEHTVKIFGIFAFLGVVLASLGLIGLAAFVTQQRTREVGIRKVLGASMGNIVTTLTKEFLVLVVAANILAWPIGYHVMKNWLENFAYRTDIGLGVFILAASIALVSALLLVSYQALKAAKTNPVDTIKYE
jgi:putative ABC transport system permease protein